MNDEPQLWRPHPWIALDTGLLRDPDIELLSAPAFRLYIAGVCHCGDELTDGHIPPKTLPRLKAEARARQPHVAELTQTGLWITLEDGSHEVRNYLCWNPTRSDLAIKRKISRDRVQRHRDSRKHAGLEAAVTHYVPITPSRVELELEPEPLKKPRSVAVTREISRGDESVSEGNATPITLVPIKATRRRPRTSRAAPIEPQVERPFDVSSGGRASVPVVKSGRDDRTGPSALGSELDRLLEGLRAEGEAAS